MIGREKHKDRTGVSWTCLNTWDIMENQAKTPGSSLISVGKCICYKIVFFSLVCNIGFSACIRSSEAEIPKFTHTLPFTCIT